MSALSGPVIFNPFWCPFSTATVAGLVTSTRASHAEVQMLSVSYFRVLMRHLYLTLSQSLIESRFTRIV